jgi:hypothetical protein
LIGPIFGLFAIDTQEQVKVAVHGAKAPYGYRKNGIEFFESLVDPFFPLKAVLIGKQMGLTAASGNAVIPTTYGRIDKSAASFSHGKFPPKNNRFSQQNLPNRRIDATCCACPFFASPLKPPLLPTKDRLNKTHKGPCSVTHSTIGAISCSSVLSSSLTKASPLGQSERVTTASRAYSESMFPSDSLNVLPFGKTTASLPGAFY